MLRDVLRTRVRGTPPAVIARAFHRTLARGLARALVALTGKYAVDTIVLSGASYRISCYWLTSAKLWRIDR